MSQGPASAEEMPPSPTMRRIVMALAGLILLAAIGLVAWVLFSGHEAQQPGSASIDVGTKAEPADEHAAPPPAPDVKLGPVPDPGLIADSAYGALPVTGSDGRKPWQVYARPFQAEGNKPRIAIVFTEIGLNAPLSRQAIGSLRPEISFAISSYAEGGQDWVRAARAAGHEVLLSVPMEPVNYPEDDPGPLTLLTSLSHDQNQARLSRALATISGYVGIINRMGSRFTAARASLGPVIETLAYRGLMMVDASTSQYSLAATMAAQGNVPHAFVTRTLDDTPSQANIKAQLNQLERVAEAYGTAVGLARPYPVSVRTVNDWAADLASRNIQLAPVTATANRQPLPSR